MAKKKTKPPPKAAVQQGALKGDIASIREEIDAVDEQLHSLINRRANLARAVGISKHASGHLVDYYRPEREAEVLRMALARNRNGSLRDEEILRLFREIMSACLAQQNPLKVGFLGPEGTFTQQAVLKHFGHSVRALPLTSVEEVFHEVESGAADFGVVPIENSSEGTVNNTLDMFLTSPLKICSEVELRIHQNLMGAMESLEGIKRVCGHPQALAQCRIWLQENLPGVERVPVGSNAEGARRARDEEGTAAIAGATAADVYGLNLLVPQIEDRPDNTTRFLVIGRKSAAPSTDDKTTLMISGSHTDAPGALFRLLELIDEGVPAPVSVLGGPVGFVGSAQSKDELIADPRGLEYLVVRGRRGGSAMAAAAVNAIASERE